MVPKRDCAGTEALEVVAVAAAKRDVVGTVSCEDAVVVPKIDVLGAGVCEVVVAAPNRDGLGTGACEDVAAVTGATDAVVDPDTGPTAGFGGF